MRQTTVPTIPIRERRSAFLIRFLLPSAADLVFVVVLFSLSIGVLAPRLLGDAGIGWHIRNGELILQNHAITRTDPFSASVGGQVWYAWEWLYDISIAAIHDHLGLNGVILFTAGLISLTFAVVLHVAIRSGAGLPGASLFVALATGASTIHFFARPHVLSWLFTAIWFWLFDSAETDPAHSRRLYWLPFLMLLWVNLHGGFVVGFVLLGIYFLSALFGRSAQRAKTLGVVGVLCLAASFMNPYGYQLHVHVYRYLTDRFLMDHIEEFLSPNFHGVAQQCFAALLLVSMIAMAARQERLRPSQLMVLLFAVYSGLFASRNLPVSSILITFIVAPILTRAIEQEHAPTPAKALLRRWTAFSTRMTHMELRSRGHGWPTVIFIALLWACWHGGWVHTGFDAKRFPVKGVDYIAQHKIGDPIFCPDYWGGYLIYRLHPQNRVVVDDRHDLYGDQFLRKYLRTIRVEPDWNELLDEYHVRWALLPAGSSLANILRASGKWEVRSRDDVGVLFENAHE
jgi:hypothetical protein